MKRLIFSFIGMFLGLMILSSVDAFDVNLGVSISSDAPCATNYTRIGLNCYETGHTGTQVQATTTCSALNLTSTFGIPSTAKLILMPIEGHLVSGTVAGGQFSFLQFYSDSNCSTTLPGATASLALTLASIQYDTNPNGTLIRIPIFLPLYIGGQTTVYVKKQDTLQTGASSIWNLREPIYYLEFP